MTQDTYSPITLVVNEKHSYLLDDDNCNKLNN